MNKKITRNLLGRLIKLIKLSFVNLYIIRSIRGLTKYILRYGKIDLSPRQILSYLTDLEVKVPIVNNKYYEPTGRNVFLSNSNLELEASQILKYVGLSECVPTCHFKELNNNDAGCTINNSSEKDIPIYVHNHFIGNAKACRAILAHEICHKVLYLNGIDYKPPFPNTYNEIFADLCTIYIGLGKVVLDGYFEINFHTQRMGYLSPNMYLNTYSIIAHTTKRYPPEGRIDEFSDPLLEEALRLWYNTDVQQLIRNTLIKNEEKLAELNRNILLLQQILGQIYTRHSGFFRKLSKEARNVGLFSMTPTNKPIALFSRVYESQFNHSEEGKFSIAQAEIQSLILALTDEYNDIDLGALSYDKVKCPCCGTETKTTNEDRSTLIQCSSCHTVFLICNSRLNITKMRRTRERLNAIKQKADKDLEEKSTRIELAKAALDIESARIEVAKKNINNKIEAARNKGYESASRLKNQQYKELIDALPKWLKLIIGNRLPAKL
ncbi:MAG: hypothetical protein ACI308_04585 [Muribaculaceae bacterium]